MGEVGWYRWYIMDSASLLASSGCHTAAVCALLAALLEGTMRLRGTPRGADCERPLGACAARPQLLLRASSTASCMFSLKSL